MYLVNILVLASVWVHLIEKTWQNKKREHKDKTYAFVSVILNGGLWWLIRLKIFSHILECFLIYVLQFIILNKHSLSVLWCNVCVALHSLLWKWKVFLFFFFFPNISGLCTQVLVFFCVPEKKKKKGKFYSTSVTPILTPVWFGSLQGIKWWTLTRRKRMCSMTRNFEFIGL